MSESKFLLSPNGRTCGELKERNSGGRLSCLVESSATAVVVVVAVEDGGLREHGESKVVGTNKVRRFEDKRRQRNTRLVVTDLVLLGDSIDRGLVFV